MQYLQQMNTHYLKTLSFMTSSLLMTPTQGISITQKPSDSTLFIAGVIRDDYGFYDLEFISEITGEKTDTIIKENAKLIRL